MTATTPAEFTRALIDEIIWWHNQTGNPVTYEQIMSPARDRYISRARHDCMRRIRRVRAWSFPRIGRYFGRDHTTVLHAMNRDAYIARRAKWNLKRATA
jgi:chromosomal replication initiation ATPase DnaA